MYIMCVICYIIYYIYVRNMLYIYNIIHIYFTLLKENSATYATRLSLVIGILVN